MLQVGVDAFRAKLVSELDGTGVRIDHAQPQDSAPYERRELLGVHPQPDPSLSRVGVHVPSGRLSAAECREIGELADKYSNGEARLTVEQNLIFANVATSSVEAMLKEPALTSGRLAVDPGNIVGHTISCTGAQFCGLALVETKASADRVARLLNEQIEVASPLRIHWTGCPNSCGQVQAADIGLMGGPAKKMNDQGQMKAVPGVKIFVGGTIGETGKLALDETKLHGGANTVGVASAHTLALSPNGYSPNGHAPNGRKPPCPPLSLPTPDVSCA